MSTTTHGIAALPEAPFPFDFEPAYVAAGWGAGVQEAAAVLRGLRSDNTTRFGQALTVGKGAA